MGINCALCAIVVGMIFLAGVYSSKAALKTT